MINAEKVVKVLKGVEWVRDECGCWDVESCAWCGGLRSNGHVKGCELAALLREAEGDERIKLLPSALSRSAPRPIWDTLAPNITPTT